MKYANKIIASFLLAILLVSNAATAAAKVKAQDATSAASPETNQKLRERIEKIVDEKKDQVKGTIDDLSLKKRGFIGEVQRVTQEAITVKSRKGTQIVPITSEVALVKAGKAINISAVAVGDWVVVIGTITGDTFTPRRIIVAGQSLRPRDHLVALGTVEQINTKEITVLTRQGEQITLTINTKTKYQDSDGDKADAKKFSKDMQVLVVGYNDADNKFATTIRTIVPLESLEEDE